MLLQITIHLLIISSFLMNSVRILQQYNFLNLPSVCGLILHFTSTYPTKYCYFFESVKFLNLCILFLSASLSLFLSLSFFASLCNTHTHTHTHIPTALLYHNSSSGANCCATLNKLHNRSSLPLLNETAILLLGH